MVRPYGHSDTLRCLAKTGHNVKNKNEKNVENKVESTLKLTLEEIKSIRGFENLNSEEEDNLIDMVYNLSIVLYKTFEND